MKLEKSNNRNGWRTVKLGEVCELNPRRPKLDRATSKPTTFVQMSAVAENGGGIVRPETRPFGEVAKGYTYFAEGDVIFAKITPCMQNGKHAIAENLLDGIGFGSTEFHVFRPGGEIISEWILNFLLQPKVLTEATRHFTGAVGQQRVPENVLANMEISLPPVAEQRRIASQVRKQMAEAERARAAVQAQLEAAQNLPIALLRDIFNNPTAKRWPRRKLDDLCEIVAKQVDPRDSEYGKLPHVSGENIVSGLCQLINVRSAAEDGMISGKYLFETGDVLYSKLRPYLRKVAIAESRGLCSADMYPLRVNPKLMDARFTAWMLLSEDFSGYAIKESQRSRMPKLNREQLFAWSAPVPPLAEQKKIATRLDSEIAATMQLCNSLEMRINEIELLPAALLRSAFSQQN